MRATLWEWTQVNMRTRWGHLGTLLKNDCPDDRNSLIKHKELWVEISS